MTTPAGVGVGLTLISLNLNDIFSEYNLVFLNLERYRALQWPGHPRRDIALYRLRSDEKVIFAYDSALLC